MTTSRGWKEILRRARQSSARTGVPVDVYLAHVAGGEAWCSGHQGFHSGEDFGTVLVHGTEYRSSSCRNWRAKEKEPNWKAAARMARQYGHTGRCLGGPVPERGCYVRWGPLDHRHCACGEPMAVMAERCGGCERRGLQRAA